MSILGDHLRELRGSQSQREMADPVGLKYQAWDRYEKGIVAPGADILQRICRAHACSADWLLGIKEDTSKMVIKTGNNSPIIAGSNNNVSLGESPVCSKCPYKRKLKQLEKLFNK